MPEPQRVPDLVHANRGALAGFHVLVRLEALGGPDGDHRAGNRSVLIVECREPGFHAVIVIPAVQGRAGPLHDDVGAVFPVQELVIDLLP